MNNSEDRTLIPESFWDEYFICGGFDLKFLGVGVSTLPIPTFHKKNMIESAQEMRNEDYQYQSISDNPLKNQFLKHFPPLKIFESIEKRNLAITSGANTATSIAIQTFVSSGEEVIFIEPVYASHFGRILSRKDINIRVCRMEYNEVYNRFQLNFGSLKKILSDKSRLLVVCNPCNPATHVWTKQEFIALSEIVKEYPRLIVVEDSAYFCYVSEKVNYIPFGSLSKESFAKSITIFSAGKMFNITGVRIGLVVAPPNLIQNIQKTQLLQVSFASSQDSNIIGKNLKDAVQQNFYSTECKRHEKICKQLVEKLDQIGIPSLLWQGSYYIVIHVEKFRNKIDKKWFKRMDNELYEPFLDKAVCRYFYKESVGIMPLSYCYFQNPEDAYIRVPFNRKQSQIEIFLNTCRKFMNMIQQNNTNQS